MATTVCPTILRSLLLTFFVCQAYETRVPVGNVSPSRSGEFLVVYFAVPPSDTPVILYGGPARFGIDLNIVNPIETTVQRVQPLDGCTNLTNSDTLRGKIAIVQRGNCQFAEKALYIQRTGAVGAIVIDYNPGLSSKGFPVFVMGSGSVTERITIPLVFLYVTEGEQLLNASNRYPNLIVGISGRLPTTVPKTEVSTEAPTTEQATEKLAWEVVSVSSEELQHQHLRKTDTGEESGTQLSTLHIALICGGGVLVILTVVVVSLVCLRRSSRKKSGGSPDAIQFSRLDS